MSPSRLASFALCLAVGGGCAQILGTDFDVVPLEGGGGGVAPTGGGGQSSASTASVGSGGAGGQGLPETIWEGDRPFDIVTDDNFVYFSSQGGPETAPGIYRLAKGGGSAEAFDLDLPGANRLVLHDGELFFTAGADGLMETWKVGRCSPATLECEILSSQPAKPIGLAADGDDIYFTSGPTTVMRVKRTGGVAQVVLTVPAVASYLLVAQGYLWGTALEAGKVWRIGLPIPIGATTPSETVDVASANALAELGTTVAVGQTMLNGGIYQLSSFGTPLLMAEGQDVVADMTSFGSHLYWANFGGGQIMRIPHVGGTPTVLAQGEASPNGIAVDDGFVYFTCFDERTAGGAVRQLALP